MDVRNLTPEACEQKPVRYAGTSKVQTIEYVKKKSIFAKGFK
jgi:hypothetical protein